MLQESPGKYLLEKYTFSYLPGRHYLERKSELNLQPPLLIQPAGFSRRKGAAAEIRSLKTLCHDLKILNSLEINNSLKARWIHLASHLRLDRRYWLNSSLGGDDSSKPIADFLKRKMNCSLLSLGVCESANSATSASPYWMGFSEMLLLNGAETLLTSRWRLDELSAPIYVNFLRLSMEGMPMDQALRAARLKFLKPKKSGLPAESSHPFYWAGITYIGEPGRTLAVSPGKRLMAGAFPVIFWLILLAVFCLACWLALRHSTYTIPGFLIGSSAFREPGLINRIQNLYRNRLLFSRPFSKKTITGEDRAG
jgi:CHAT domain-containing protein